MLLTDNTKPIYVYVVIYSSLKDIASQSHDRYESNLIDQKIKVVEQLSVSQAGQFPYLYMI